MIILYSYAVTFSSTALLKNRIATPAVIYYHRRNFPKKSPLHGSVLLEDNEDSEGVLPGSSMKDQAIISGSKNNENSHKDETLHDESKENLHQVMGMPVQSLFLLNLVVILWGTQHSVIKLVVDDVEGSSDTATGANSVAAAFTLARFFIGALLGSPFTPSISPVFDWIAASIHNSKLQSRHSSPLPDFESSRAIELLTWRWGAETGLWMFLGYALQAIGLEYTTASKSGFILYLNVKFVPFFARILFGRHISTPTWISAATALLGTALITYDKSGKDAQSFVNVGDLWSIGAAMASAMFIIRLESALAQIKNSSALNSASLWVVTLLSCIWTLGSAAAAQHSSANSLFSMFSSASEGLLNVIRAHPLALLYLGGVTTLTNYLQNIGQRGITAERASILYALDPVYCALFAYLFIGERFGVYGFIGATIITVAAVTNAVIDFGNEEKSE